MAERGNENWRPKEGMKIKIRENAKPMVQHSTQGLYKACYGSGCYRLSLLGSAIVGYAKQTLMGFI